MLLSFKTSSWNWKAPATTPGVSKHESALVRKFWGTRQSACTNKNLWPLHLSTHCLNWWPLPESRTFKTYTLLSHS